MSLERLHQRLPDDNPRKPLFYQRRAEALNLADETEEVGPSGRAFLRVSAFVSTFNLDWYAVGQTV